MSKKITMGIQDKVLESDIQKMITEVHNATVSESAVAALKGLKLKHVFLTMKSGFEKIRAFAKKRIQLTYRKAQEILENPGRKREKEELEKQADESSRELDGVKTDKARHRDSYGSWSLFPVYLSFVLLILLVDVILNSPNLQALSLNYLSSYLIGFVFLLGLAVAAHFLGEAYREAKTKKHKLMWALITVIIGVAVFVGLDLLRQIYLASTAGVESPSIFWITANTGLFFVAMIISATLLPSTSEYKNKGKYLGYVFKERRLEKKLNTINRKLDKINNENQALDSEILLLEEYLEDLLEYIRKEESHTKKTAKKEYILKGGSESKG